MEILSNKQDASIVNSSGKTYARVTQETPTLIVIGKPEKEVSHDDKKHKMEELKKAAIQCKVALTKT